MTIPVLKNVRLFTGGVDLTGRSNKISLEPEYEEKDITTFGSVDTSTGDLWKELMAGLGSGKLTASGFNEAGDSSKVDDSRWAALGGLDAWTVGPTDGNVGSIAYLVGALQGNYQFGGSPGDVAPWSASMATSLPVARGGILHPPGTARTATGTGTIVDLSTVGMSSIPSGKGLYASLHVLSVSGTSTPSLTVAVQTAASVGFGSPTTQITFPAYTAIGGERRVLAGPITDGYARVSYTISGTTPSFLFVCAVGIANA
ncbi:hypothetical protein [Krasilnikovia sp. MM14-A1259]|uniref:hypothetical protein n=1 Tax=Krasilnikovia sp. MM14-A1259 TaxID=3373539 RepID=UPI00380992A5